MNQGDYSGRGAFREAAENQRSAITDVWVAAWILSDRAFGRCGCGGWATHFVECAVAFSGAQ